MGLLCFKNIFLSTLLELEATKEKANEKFKNLYPEEVRLS
jgi:hypothetical protein